MQPLERVGCYVPGGRYPLPSTLLMTAIPARVAGVREVIVCCPHPTPAVLAAAREAGVTRIVAIGGAQAIAALAYGTESIPRVDKIVGPGNAWVAAAKALVAQRLPDRHARRAERDRRLLESRPRRLDRGGSHRAGRARSRRARDLRDDGAIAGRGGAARSARRSCRRRGRRARRCARNGGIVIARTRRRGDRRSSIASRRSTSSATPAKTSASSRAAGTIFVGGWSAQAAGDYCTGSNHVLPTGGAARFRGGLNAADFVRVFTVQTLTPARPRAIGPAVMALAEAEGLTAHAASIRIRLGRPRGTSGTRRTG